MAKNLIVQLFKATISKLLLITLAAAFWILLYISGCSMLLSLSDNSFAVMLYVLALWLIIPTLFILTCWQYVRKHQVGKTKPYQYGLLLCLSLFLWALLSIMMGLGPCYRYQIVGTNYFGEILYAIITAPLFLLEAGYRLTSFSFPTLELFSLAIVYSIGYLYGYIKSYTFNNHE